MKLLVQTFMPMTGNAGWPMSKFDFQKEAVALYAKQLRLPSFNQYRDVLRQLDDNQSYEDFLIAMMKLELQTRQETAVRRRIKAAGFPYLKTLDEFDCTYLEHVSEPFVQQLASCDFVSNRQNIVMVGNPGTGKTHLSIALGHKACL